MKASGGGHAKARPSRATRRSQALADPMTGARLNYIEEVLEKTNPEVS